MERNDPEYVLRGNALKVYLFLLRHKEPVGMTEVQKNLSFSSASLAVHHLEKLISLGIVEKDEHGRFSLVKKVDVSVLQGFANVGSLMLPRMGFYASFFIVIAVAYIVLNISSYNALNTLALIGTLGSAFVFVYETYRTWKKRPF